MPNTLREISLSSAFQRSELEQFMHSQGIRLDRDTEYAVGVFDDDDALLACGGHSGNVLKGFAVRPDQRGNNLLGTLISNIMERQTRQGHSLLRVFTKPQNTGLFESCGFSLVAAAKDAALLENSPNGLSRFLERALPEALKDKVPASAIVMNCNPFTKGHRHLVEHASKTSERVYVFVVEEDRSFFPFKIRFELARSACKDLGNVFVCPSGPYMISAATFPTYFLKAHMDADAVKSELDAAIFATRIAPALSVVRRIVGSEPSCALTRAYNSILSTVLPLHGVAFEEIPRLEADGAPVSASLVRKLLLQGDSGALGALLCEPTLEWMRSGEGSRFLQNLQEKSTATPYPAQA